jgi:hypothetical protein
MPSCDLHDHHRASELGESGALLLNSSLDGIHIVCIILW